MRIHQTTLPEITASLSPAKSKAPQTPHLGVMQEQAAFTPLSQKAGHADFSLHGLLNKLPSMPISISLPSMSQLFASGKDVGIDMLGKKPKMYESNLEISCKDNGGKALMMEQDDYLQALKTQLSSKKKEVQDIMGGACFGLSMVWLLGRHSGLDDNTVTSNMLGYDVDEDEITSQTKAKHGVEQIHFIQKTVQRDIGMDGHLDDKRFSGVTPVIRHYDVMQRMANAIKMSVVPVAGETPFVLLSRQSGLGYGLARDALRDGHEQLFSVQSDKHAMAIYSNGRDQYAFYDPNNGMFSFQSKDNFSNFMNKIGKMLEVSSEKLGDGDPSQLMIMELKVH
ncbi:YopT-type cysteine protease domain-containing protein [Brenneria izbisi]|uniref:YopT-type cysteine protease domain-containing protein n=1 Tax=Brenneria izbisi TaxID=2939450 RepID=A0AA41XVU0_9GAMM|nr:YopT-type cysteine protease domain-containing protein [Brenneria izbisi]MCV9879873.1 YopT-type cysteine protease domain-containing protein [Brenneria izbisi]MCV9883262.1 YopT-type cysteine protease domain-containing protein [Brenneria izbisi]